MKLRRIEDLNLEHLEHLVRLYDTFGQELVDNIRKQFPKVTLDTLEEQLNQFS